MIQSSELEKLVKYYHEKKLAHAYLISTNNIEKCYKVLLNVIKNIFCVQEYTENCNKCSLCHLININNLPSLKTIEPDGNFIKKEQIVELRSLFSRESQYTKESIYIIKYAQKMNKESANTMLKFLEEPEGNVIGFFLTNQKDNIMPTIQSRCQIIEVDFENDKNETYGLSKEKYDELYSNISDYLFKIEVENKNSILYNRQYLLNYEKDEIKCCFQIMLDIYKDILDGSYNENSIDDNFTFLNKFARLNIVKKMKLITNYLKKLNYNVNLELLLDSFVLEMKAINNENL